MEEHGRVRICDIAQELGVSTATVSNVLHGKTKKVSDETVRRVQRALEQWQYIPSMAGILLAQNASRIIGVVVHDHEKYEGRVLEDVFVATSLNHLSNEIEAEGRFMMVKKTRDTEDIIKFASMWNLDGLVLLGFCEQDYLYLRSHMRIPFVVYDGFCDDTEGICNITIHNYDGGLQVGKYFRSCGHSRALCIADNEICMDKERWEGFRDGFGPGAEFLRIPMHKQERMAFYEEHLEQLRQFSAVFAVSDFYAVELIHFLQEREILVPRDISVAGFDDTPMCRMVFPALTSVRQDVALRARISMEQLQALRTGEETVNAVTLPVELVIRDSTK